MIGIFLFSCLFVILLVSKWIFGDQEVQRPSKDYMIEIATISPTPRRVVRPKANPRLALQVKTEKPRLKVKAKPAPSGKDHPLYEDCVQALVVLGEKSASSKKTAASILGSQKIDSVEQFITVVYSKS